MRLHGLVGEALEAVYAADSGPHLAELAHHFVAAAPSGEQMVGRAVRTASLAGRRALELLAWEEAAGLFERALAALELAERPDPQQRCQLLLSLAEARMAASEVPAARAAYQQASELARRIGAPEALARAALGLGLEFTFWIVDQLEVELLEQALAALGRADSLLRARVLARLARALLFTPQAQRRLALSEQAVELARRLGDPATLAAVLYDRHLAVWGPERAEVAGERLAAATELVQLAEQIGDRALALRGRGLRRADLLELGDLAGFDADLAAAELRQLHYRWQLPLARASRATLAGRFVEAEEQAAQCLAIGRRAGDQAAGLAHQGVVGTLRWMQGRFGELIQVYQELATRFPAAPLYRTCLAVALAEAGHADQARVEVERLAAGGLAALPRDPGWSLSLACLAGPATTSAMPSSPLSCTGCWSRTPTATSLPAASAPCAWARRPTSWGCWTSPSAVPSRPCAALRMRPRSPAASGPARWSPAALRGRPGRCWPLIVPATASRPRLC